MPTQAETEFAFDESVRLLLELHRLIAAGDGDGPEADRVRDAMEAPWYAMAPEHRELVDDLSADLYSIGVDRTEPPGRAPAGYFEELSAHWEAEKWPDALRLLREHEKELPPEFVAGMRGTYWYQLYQYDVALAFHNEALRLSPHDPFREAGRLSSQIRTAQKDQALLRAEEILARESEPDLLVAASNVFGVAAGSADPAACRSLMQKSLSAAERAAELLDRSPNDAVSAALRANAQVHRAVCLEYLGHVQHAVQACEFAEPKACAVHFAKLREQLRSERASSTAPSSVVPPLDLVSELQCSTMSAF